MRKNMEQNIAKRHRNTSIYIDKGFWELNRKPVETTGMNAHD